MQDQNKESKEMARISQMAEILGIMDEKHLDRDWLLRELKTDKIKISSKDTKNSYEILKKCSPEYIAKKLQVLKGEDIDDFENINYFTRTYHWFFTDIVAGSNPNLLTKDQVRKVVVLNELVSRIEIFKNRDKKTTLILPTGDGMAIGFAHSAEEPLRLAIELHKLINKYNKNKRGKEKLLLRIGLDMGPVYVVKDLKGQDNVWGPGIILTRRVMDLGDDMQILAGERLAQDIQKLHQEYKAIFHPIGYYSIKHGEKLRLYNIYGEGFGNKKASQKSKIRKKKDTVEETLGIGSFTFGSIEIRLEIIDMKRMLVKHTWIWNVINTSEKPREQIFYYLDGDTPKEFSDLNVHVTDEEKNELDILSLNVNKPTHKEFNVKLKKPLKPKQRKRFLNLVYDWEEPERNFEYTMATDCKRFKYVLTLPKDSDTKVRVLKIDTEMGYKWLSESPPKVEYVDDRAQITWEEKNLKAHDTYRIEW